MQLPLSNQGSRVVIIGSSTYDSQELADIPSIARTIDALSSVFIERCGVAAEQLTVLQNPQSTEEFGTALASACETATGPLLVYLVGHGIVNDDTGELYIAHSKTAGDPRRLAFTAVRYATIREILLNSPASSLHVVIDCCFAGRAIGTLARGDALDSTRVYGASVLAAAASDELALAPTNEEYTKFSGAIIDYINAGDPAGPQYIRLRDIHGHLVRKLPAVNAPKPRFMANQNADNLVLCRNPAINSASTQEATSQTPAGDLHMTLAERDLEKSVLGSIFTYDGWTDFNPLPATLMGVDSRVPRTPDQIGDLLRERPPNWEARLFAGTAIQDLDRLRPMFAKHFRGPFLPSGKEASGQVAFDYLRSELNIFGGIVQQIGSLFADGRHSSILESEDVEQILAHTRELTAIIEELMEFSERLRSIAILNRHLRRAGDILAHFADQPLISMTRLVQKYTSEVDSTGARIARGDEFDIHLTVQVEIPNSLSEAFTEAMSRY